jgi:hypothetical protein
MSPSAGGHWGTYWGSFRGRSSPRSENPTRGRQHLTCSSSLEESRTPCHMFAGVRREPPDQENSAHDPLFHSPKFVEVRRRRGQVWVKLEQPSVLFVAV